MGRMLLRSHYSAIANRCKPPNDRTAQHSMGIDIAVVSDDRTITNFDIGRESNVCSQANIRHNSA